MEAGERRSSSSTCPTRPAAPVRVGLSTCYDLRFPELYRAPARRGRHGVRRPGRVADGAGRALDPARPGPRDREPVRRPRLQHRRHPRAAPRWAATRRSSTADREGRWPPPGLTSRCSASRSTSRPRPPWRAAFPVLRDRRLPLAPASTATARAGCGSGRPELAGRGWLNTGGATHPGRPARPDRRPRLLDLLLRQLPARPRRAAPAGGAVRRRAGPHRRALAEVRARGRPGRARRRGRALRRAPPGARRPRARDLAGLHRPRLADARRHRPRGLRRRLDVGRGPRPGLAVLVDELIDEHAAKGTLRRGDAPVRPAAAGRHRAALPRQGGRAARRLVHRLRHRPPPGRRTSSRTCHRARPGSGRRRASSTSRRACSLAARRDRRRGSATTSSSPTRSTTRSRACGSPTARPRRSPAPAGSCASAPAAARRSSRTSRPRGTWPGSIGRVVIAMAGTHQLWALHLATDPADNTVAVLGGHVGRRHPRRRRPTRRGSPSPPAWRRPPTAAALWVADSETSALRSLDAHRRRLRRRPPTSAGPVRLRPPGRRRRPGAAAAPARRHRPARRLGGRQRHLQRRDPPLRPGDRPGEHPGHRACASPATRSSRSTPATATAAAGRRRVRGPPARADRVARRGASASTASPARPSARRTEVAAGPRSR